MTHVIEQVVTTTDDFIETIHHLLDDIRRGFIEWVDPFACLEEDVRVLGRSTQLGAFRFHAALVMLVNFLFVDHGTHVIFSQRLDLLHLV